MISVSLVLCSLSALHSLLWWYIYICITRVWADCPVLISTVSYHPSVIVTRGNYIEFSSCFSSAQNENCVPCSYGVFQTFFDPPLIAVILDYFSVRSLPSTCLVLDISPFSAPPLVAAVLHRLSIRFSSSIRLRFGGRWWGGFCSLPSLTLT